MDLLMGTVQLAARDIQHVIGRAVTLSERSTLQMPVDAVAWPAPRAGGGVTPTLAASERAQIRTALG